jgi:hypothetical protein
MYRTTKPAVMVDGTRFQFIVDDTEWAICAECDTALGFSDADVNGVATARHIDYWNIVKPGARLPEMLCVDCAYELTSAYYAALKGAI